MLNSRFVLTTAACSGWLALSPLVAAQSACGIAAAVDIEGTGCGATLVAGGMPVLGTLVPLDLRSNLGNAPAWVLLSPAGNPPSTIETCNLFLDLGKLTTLVTLTTDPGGDATALIGVPTRTELCGRQFNVQALVGSQVGPLSFGGLSNGLKVTLGS